jgi:hypothetical protein
MWYGAKIEDSRAASLLKTARKLDLEGPDD